MIENKDNLQYLLCSTCNGLGYIRDDRCHECRGRGIIAYLDTYILSWSKKIDSRYLKLYKIERIIGKVVFLILFILGILGVASLIYSLYLVDFNPDTIFKISYWLEYESVYILLFWISLIIDMFLAYQHSVNSDKRVNVVYRKFKSEDDIERVTPPPANWSQVKEYGHKNKIDISKSFNAESHKIVEQAFKIAEKYNALEVAPIHFFIASLMLSTKAQNIFIRLGINLKDFANKIGRVATKQPKSEGITVFSAESTKILLKAYRRAYSHRQDQVDVTEIIEEAVNADELLQEVLFDIGLDLEKISNVIIWFRIREQMRKQWIMYRASSRLKSKTGMDRALTAVQTPFLNKFSEDLTMMAKLGYLNLCIGREKTFSEIFRVLEGSSIKGVIMSGEPGVGQTAIIEGLAQKMIADDVPEFLKDKRLVSLSVSSLVAGASISDAQERLLIVFNEIAKAGNVILYIDNFHELIDIAGGNLIDVLHETLSRNMFILIASTTALDYSKHVENSSVGNVMKRIKIDEPEINDAIQILEGKVNALEGKNNVFFSYHALEQAVKLTDRYVNDKFLPYKAISLIEEVAVWANKNKGSGSLVSGNDVAALLSEKIGMQITEITESESEKLLNLEDVIHERMIDQEEAVSAVANSLRRARAELRDKDRPIATLLFLGPTGVGKTELAKTIAHVYFGNEENMIRMDMSEYQEKDSVKKLIGAPPGYEGSSFGGLLTEAVRKKPFSIVLLDELEKAHPDILNLFLQVMEDGRLTDSTGRTVDFTNVILIATSNAGTSYIQEQVELNTPLEKIKEQLLETELKSAYRPEFLNRFDNIIVFKPLTLENVVSIARLYLNDVAKNLEAKGINFRATEEAINELSEKGFDPKFGARPLRRVIQENVDNALAEFLLKGEINRRDVAVLETGNIIKIEKAKEL